uniref:CCHC-type domain-containing protein n=1 Tax=Zea mays TaxID=4577 RepID=A0A804LMW1_MAIZE
GELSVSVGRAEPSDWATAACPVPNPFRSPRPPRSLSRCDDCVEYRPRPLTLTPRRRRPRRLRQVPRDGPFIFVSLFAGRRAPARFRNDLCNNCKRPGHFARECPSVAVCHTCGLPGHIAAECSSKGVCWNCKEPGHMANSCPNEGICRNCGKSGHIARDCTAPPVPPGEVILCSNCYKPGHFREECTNEKACNNCRQSGHLARNCTNDPVCNLCNVAGHLARQCPKSDTLGERGGPPPFRGVGAPFHDVGAPFRGGFSDVVCRACNQIGHTSRDCMAGAFMICHNCGGRGHMAYECPSASLMDRFPPRRF